MPILSRAEARDTIVSNHYLRSFPSGWTFSYLHETAVVVYSIPANPYLGRFLFNGNVVVRELARLWAPDGHRANLLTEAIALSLRYLRSTGCEAVVSFADSQQTHHGGVYQAASWIYTGRSSESRVYVNSDGRTVSRRSFHSGNRSTLPPGLEPRKLPGKHRYVKPLTRTSRRLLKVNVLPYPHQGVEEII